jgi:hypothetical protein
MKVNSAWKKVATNKPSVNCIIRSRRKRCIRRGPNCVAAAEKTSRLTEKIKARTVLTAPIIAPSRARASSTFPTDNQTGRANAPRKAAKSIANVAAKIRHANNDRMIGIVSRLVPGAISLRERMLGIS